MCVHDDAQDPSTLRRESHRSSTLERLEHARDRLLGWRDALEAAGFRTNLSLAPPCSLAARRGEDGDERWVTLLPTGLVALERRGVGEGAPLWSRLVEVDREPTIDELVRGIRALFARAGARSRGAGPTGVVGGRPGGVDAWTPAPSGGGPAEAAAPGRA